MWIVVTVLQDVRKGATLPVPSLIPGREAESLAEGLAENRLIGESVRNTATIQTANSKSVEDEGKGDLETRARGPGCSHYYMYFAYM